jgi:hypothetical protein
MGYPDSVLRWPFAHSSKFTCSIQHAWTVSALVDKGEQADTTQDYKIFDSKSVALESGRYMETLGFMSIDGLSTGGTKNGGAASQKSKITFARRYIDNNVYSMHHHSGKDDKSFPTKHGLKVSEAIGDARKSLGLTHKYGCAPHDYWVNRRPYPHNESIFTLIEKQMIPQTISKSDRVKSGGKALLITNTGSIRFDIFKGAFTKDTKFLVSPFTSAFRYIADVPYKAASQVIKLLNNEGPIVLEMMQQNTFLQPPEVHAARFRPHILSSQRFEYVRPGHEQAILKGEEAAVTSAPTAVAADAADTPIPTCSFDLGKGEYICPKAPGTELFPGYTTKDDAGSDGDDTIHSEIKFYSVPNCIQSVIGFGEDDDQSPETVDLMYNEFIQKWILLALEYTGQKYTSDDTKTWAEGKSFTDIMTEWVEEHWASEGEKCAA